MASIRVKKALEDDEASSGKSWAEIGNQAIETATKTGKWVWSNATFLTWVVVTAGIITAFPLVFEIDREEQVEAFEEFQAKMLEAEGRSSTEIKTQGIAVPPKVFN